VEEGNAMQSTEGYAMPTSEKAATLHRMTTLRTKSIRQKNGNTCGREKALARKVYGGYLALARVGAVGAV
jgi:hypothetical protein